MKKLKELKILIVGLGQIGASIGLGLVEKERVAEVIGYDTDPSAIRQAFMNKVITRKAKSLESELDRADLVILAAPIRAIIEMIPTVCAGINDSAAVLDVAGTKTEIFDAVSRCGRKVNYIGGHPMAGDERRGIESAEPHKFVGRPFILIPFSREVDEEWLYTIMHLLTKLRAKPIIMSAEEHDRLIARTSHLPYAVSLALMQTIVGGGGSNGATKHLIGGSLISATRVAASSPELTLDMFMTNRGNIVSAVDEMITGLAELKEIIRSGNEGSLMNLIETACKTRRAFPA